MRLCLLFIGILVTLEICQIAYRRKRGGRSRPLPRIITNRTDEYIGTYCKSNVPPLQIEQSAQSRTKQKTADHNNLVSITTLPIEQLVKFGLINAQSTRNKVDLISEYIVNDQINVAAITETWLTKDDEQLSNDITPKGYTMHHATRDGRRGGGVAIIAESRFKPTVFRTQPFASFEKTSVKLSFKKAPLVVTTIYRPPEKPIGVFLSDFQTFLEDMLDFQGDILITGDFNIHISDLNNNLVARFHELLDTFGLTQHVNVPTHRSGHTLDLIITRNEEFSPVAPPATDTLLSDHFSIYCHFSMKKPAYETRTIKTREIGNINQARFRDDLQQISSLTSPPEDIDTLVDVFNAELSGILDQHAPSQSRTKKIRPLNPWFDDEVLAAKKERRRCERIWLNTRTEKDKLNFRSSSNSYIQVLERKKRPFIVKKSETVVLIRNHSFPS